MTFSRIRPFGSWLDGGTLDQTELEAFDDHLSKAIDGDGGGTYAPSSQIVIGGAGLRIDGNFLCTDPDPVFSQGLAVDGIGLLTNHVAAAASIHSSGTLDVTGVSILHGDLTVLGNGAFQQNVGISGGLLVASNSAFEADLLVSGTFTHAAGNFALFNGATNFSGLTGLLGPTVVNDVLEFVSDGRAKWRLAAATDADHTFSINSADRVFIPSNSTLTASRTWTIDDVGAQDGMEMRLSRALDTSSNSIFVKRADTSTICALHAADNQSVTIVRHGGTWKLFEYPKAA